MSWTGRTSLWGRPCPPCPGPWGADRPGFRRGSALTGFAADPGEVGYVALEYQDGSRYVLEDRSANQLNVSYRMSAGADVGLNQEEYRLVFNRLVDIEQVSAVVVNDTVLPVS